MIKFIGGFFVSTILMRVVEPEHPRISLRNPPLLLIGDCYNNS